MANLNRQKLTHEASLNKSLHKEKERVEKKFEESTAKIKSLQEQIATIGKELKKAKGARTIILTKFQGLNLGRS